MMLKLTKVLKVKWGLVSEAERHRNCILKEEFIPAANFSMYTGRASWGKIRCVFKTLEVHLQLYGM